MVNEQEFYLFGQIQTSQTGGQPYSDTFPLRVLSPTIVSLEEILFDNLTVHVPNTICWMISGTDSLPSFSGLANKSLLVYLLHLSF